MFHVQGGIFPCVFLNLWSQEKISPYSKTTFLLLKFQGLRFFIFLFIILSFFINIIILLTKIGPIWAHKGPYGPGFYTGPEHGRNTKEHEWNTDYQKDCYF